MLFAVAIAAALIVPALFQDGMFADGILYAAVAKNSADGLGTFWHPHFMKTMHDHFHEQPPLGIFLQSIFFRIFSGIYPERIYELVVALIDGWLIVRIWKNSFAEKKEMQNLSAWPVFLFFISPVVFWAFTNNVLETTMAMFALAATDAIITALIHQRKTALHLFLAGIFIICASMIKGPQGIFPIVFPAILWLCGKQVSFKKAVIACLALTAIFVLFYVIVLIPESSRETYTSWYSNRIANTFAGTNNTSGSHFRLLYDLFLDLIPPALIAFLIFMAGKKTAGAIDSHSKKTALAFLLLGFSGSLPLMVTLEQRPFYLTTAIPFFTLAIGFFSAPFIAAVYKKTEGRNGLWKFTGAFASVLLLAVLVITMLIAGTPKRNGPFLHDMRLCAKIAGNGTSIGCSSDIYNDWAAVNYFMRYENIEINPNTEIIHARYFISTDGTAPEGWKPVSFDRQYLYLFEKP